MEDKMPEEETKEAEVEIVTELPQQPVVGYKKEDGTEVHIITLLDAIKEIYTDVKAIKKAVG
jgi:hypothetical protein